MSFQTLYDYKSECYAQNTRYVFENTFHVVWRENDIFGGAKISFKVYMNLNLTGFWVWLVRIRSKHIKLFQIFWCISVQIFSDFGQVWRLLESLKERMES